MIRRDTGHRGSEMSYVQNRGTTISELHVLSKLYVDDKRLSARKVMLIYTPYIFCSNVLTRGSTVYECLS